MFAAPNLGLWALGFKLYLDPRKPAFKDWEGSHDKEPRKGMYSFERLLSSSQAGAVFSRTTNVHTEAL